ncbi:MAG: flippase-like domain-containing protein [Bacteroidales bacterium]|nr:flippase-like domain-containing protein [Bacteroidales bacterium]
MSSKGKKIIKFVLSSLLAAFFVIIAFRGVSWKDFWQGILEANWWYVGLSLVASVFALLFRALRWRDMLMTLEPDTRVLKVWDADNIGNITNLVLPGVGEFLRCGMLSTKRSPYEKTLGTILMERIWDVMAVACMILLALAINWDRFGRFFIDNVVKPASGRMTVGIGWIVLIVLALIALFMVLVFKFRDRNRFCAKIADAVKGLMAGFTSFKSMEHKFRFAMYTVGVWIMYVLMSYFVLKAIPAVSNLGMEDGLFISAVGNIASVIPVPGGIGAYHYIVSLALSGLYSVDWGIGILFATICHESHAILVLVLGVISYIHNSLHK